MGRRDNDIVAPGVTDLLLAASNGGAGLTFVEGSNDHRPLSYADLVREAISVLASMQAMGIKSGEPVILQTDDNRTTLVLLWACLFGGMLPALLHGGGAPEHLRKVWTVWRTLDFPWIATDNKRLKVLKQYWESKGGDVDAPPLRSWCADAPAITSGSARLTPGHGDEPAMLQFSSGSTGEPKGIVLTHRNLIANTRAIIGRGNMTPADQIVSWVPLSHDMGMVGVHFSAALHGIPCAIMPTPLFVRNPGLWMDTANILKATVLYSTNFALDFLVEFLEKPASTTAWDLSHVRIVFLGAEPILPRSCRRFAAFFAGNGLRENCLMPSYGLAEGTLAVTMPFPGTSLSEHLIDPASLSIGSRVVKASANCPAIPYIACGQPVEDCRIQIVDATGASLPDQHFGHILISGASVTKGYWGHLPASQADGWLDTGDLGFVVDNALVVAGRAKDVIILDGLNIYPHDVERLITEELELGPGRVVVCAVRPDPSGPEALAVFLRFRGKEDELQAIATRIRATIRSQCGGLPVAAVVPIRNFPRTTSGKPQRYALARGFESGELAPINTPEISEGSLENRLLAYATEVYGPLDPDRSFAEQGITSLLTAEFAMHLGRRFGCPIPLAKLMSMEFLHEVADALRLSMGTQRLSASGAVWLAGDWTEVAPFFLVHPGSGAVTSYLPLARRLGTTMPVVGLQAPGVECGEQLLESVEALAEHHLNTIRTVWPSGPYRVGGWSFGGLVALEIARRLRDAGHQVAPVVLFDAYLPGRRIRTGGIPSNPAKVDETIVSTLLKRHLKLGDHSSESLDGLLANARSRHLLQSMLGGAIEGVSAVRLVRCYSAALAASRRYQPAPYGGEVVLVRGRHSPPHRDPTLGWWRLAPVELTLLWTDGDHETLVDEANADCLATVTNRALKP